MIIIITIFLFFVLVAAALVMGVREDMIKKDSKRESEKTEEK